jgi:hypothetical protein
MLNSKRNFLKDIDYIRSLSSVIDKKLSKMNPSDNDKIDNLTLDELQDLNKIAGIADFMLCKYADKKEMRSILEYFVSIITETTNSVGNLDDEISELILSAEDSINKVKDLHTRIDTKSNFKKDFDNGPDYDIGETSGINLTNFATEINTVEYQQNSSGHNTR